MKQISSVLLLLALTLCMLTPAVSAAEITITGDADVPVKLTQQATAFSVTVPTVLPVDVSATGVVTIATDNKIVNNSYGPVEVKGVEVQPISPWKLVEFNTDFTKSKVGLSEFGFQLNGSNVNIDGGCESEFDVIEGGSEIGFTYAVNIAVQKIALEDVQIANVVFIVGWDEVYVAPLPEKGKDIEEYSWEEISIISKAGVGDEYFDLGDIKTFITSDSQEVAMEIVAFNADTKANGGTVGITWISKDVVATNSMNTEQTTEGGWEVSDMRNWLQNDFYNTLPDEVSKYIVSVNKTYYDKTSDSTKSCVDTVWIPSCTEIFGEQGLGVAIENSGVVYTDYFNSEASFIKQTYNGEVTTWWLRSAFLTGNFYFLAVDSSGNPFTGSANDNYGVVLGFCF